MTRKPVAKKRYRVVGSKTRMWAVVGSKGGAILYDLLESEKLATEIRDIVNDGIGPEWDLVNEELERRRASGKLGI